MNPGASEEPRALAGTQACGNELRHGQEFFSSGDPVALAVRKSAHLGVVSELEVDGVKLDAARRFTTTMARQQPA